MDKEKILFIVGIVLGSISVLILFFLSLFFYFKNFKRNNLQKKIGHFAEVKIGEKLKKWASVNHSFWIPNALYKYNDNILFEVDGILITSRALIIIEIKSISGSILGIGTQKRWIKKIHNQEFMIANPIFQNEKHLEHVMKMTKIKVPVLSMIIFSERTDKLRVTHIPDHVFLIKEEQIDESLWQMCNDLKIKMHKQDMIFLKNKIEKNITTSIKDYEIFSKYHH